MDVSIQQVRYLTLCIHAKPLDLYSSRFPYSDIPGSLLTSSSPRLFAGSHVLLRLISPRHPPIALSLFMFFFSYSSLIVVFPQYSLNCQRSKNSLLVGPDGLEPSTPRLSSACSNQLSYEPPSLLTSWWSRSDSNRRPPACKAGALPTKLRPLVTYNSLTFTSAVKPFFRKFTLCTCSESSVDLI